MKTTMFSSGAPVVSLTVLLLSQQELSFFFCASFSAFSLLRMAYSNRSFYVSYTLIIADYEEEQSEKQIISFFTY